MEEIMKTYETENLIEVYNNLVASHEKGEFAACKYNLNNGTETIEFVFTTDDLVKIETENGSKHAMLNTKYHLVEFKYTCLSTIILSIVSKVFVNKPEWKDLYDRLSEKYYIGNKVINLEREKRHKFKEMEKVRRESKRKFLDKKKSHPHLIYTPMGNKR